MFWSKKNKEKKAKQDKRQKTGTKNAGQRSSEDIRAEALANAKAARENLGEDTVQRIAEIMAKKGNSAIDKAKADIAKADPDKVLDELKWMLDSKK